MSAKELADILLVDDQPHKLVAYEAALSPLGENLIMADSGTEALQLLLRHNVAVVLLDVNMPVMDGFETAAMIRQHPRFEHMPIIFVTGVNTTEMDRLRGYELGAVDYVFVPVIPEVLRAKVSVFVDLHRKTRELVELNRDLEDRVRQRTAELERSQASEATRRHELEALIQATPAAIWVAHDRECQEVTANPAAATMMRLPLDREASEGTRIVLPRHVGAFREGKFVAPDEMPMRMAARTGRRVPTQELEFRFPDGSSTWAYGNAVPLFDDADELRGVIATFLDITEQKRAQAALREADRRKDEFLATLAHELRNPLAPLRNAVEILRRKAHLNAEESMAIDVMDRQLHQMTRLIDDLMDVSRITRNKLELRREHVELTSVIHAALETSQPIIERQGHELRVVLPDRPTLVNADLTRLAQVFSNLLNNAAKYTEQGGRIELVAETNDNEIVVSVKDTGIGIASDKLAALFEMFSQVEGALSRSQGGLGIGLSLVKRIAEMHGGSAEARSAGAGRGSEFVVRLPILVGATAPAKPVREEVETRAASLAPMRILVVDDNIDAAVSSGLLLEDMGHQVRTAHDGEEALRVAEEFLPDAILLDIGLPLINGYDACRRIREQTWGENMILVAVTGWGQDEDKKRARDAGFDRHLVKPVEPDRVVRLLIEVVELKKTARAAIQP